jgi:hypothetical protein
MGEDFANNLSFKSDRPFGTELEILAFDGKNHAPGGDIDKPIGTDYVILLIKNNADENVEWRTYEHTDNNDYWVVKPDVSCGLEVCSPIYQNWRGIKKVCKIVCAFSNDEKIRVDNRCSVHVHVDVSDLTDEQVASIVVHWIKCEAVFIDMMPDCRKFNRYCQLLYAKDNFDTDIYLNPREIIAAIGNIKHYTANTDQWRRTGGKRRSLEFRIVEGEGCKNPYLMKNWLRLILHFVEMSSRRPLPCPYRSGDQWSWICMLDTADVFRVLGFYPGQYRLSSGLTQTRNWMIARLCKHIDKTNYGPRWKSRLELYDIIDILRQNSAMIDLENNLSPTDLDEALYGEKYRF